MVSTRARRPRCERWEPWRTLTTKLRPTKMWVSPNAVSVPSLEPLGARIEVGGAQHDEQRVAEFIDLGSLVRLVGVFDRQLVETEFLLHLGQELVRRLVEAHPDEGLGILDDLADVVEGNLAQALAARVGDRRRSLRRPAAESAGPGWVPGRGRGRFGEVGRHGAVLVALSAPAVRPTERARSAWRHDLDPAATNSPAPGARRIRRASTDNARR